MTETSDLHAAARALVVVDDHEAAECWRKVIRGVDVGWLDREELEDLSRHLHEGRDFGVEELLFAHLGSRVRVSFLDDVAECDAARLAMHIDSLLEHFARSG